jgi:uncharacterized membrane protein
MSEALFWLYPTNAVLRILWSTLLISLCQMALTVLHIFRGTAL